MSNYTIQLRYLSSNFYGYGHPRLDGTRNDTFGTLTELSEVKHYDTYSDALSDVRRKYPHITESYLMITPAKQEQVEQVVYELWVQLLSSSGSTVTYALSDDHSLIPILTKGNHYALQFNSKEEATRFALLSPLANIGVVAVPVEF